jgi:ABC-2 type transport system ATP-binding protein
MSNAIEISDVSKHFRLYAERNQSLKATLLKRRRARFQEFLALNEVSLSVKSGTTYGIIGENGSGKSTLLKCVARILQPDAGSIRINGSMSALLELGAGFHPELSGRENVFLNGALLGLSKAELTDRFDDIVEFSGLERFIDNPVKTYSSGMYVRLGFSVAINVDPDVLLVDEVLAVGDEDFQQRCFEKFRDLRREGRTILLVTHALDTVRTLCDRAAWLEHGVVRAEGSAGTVVEDYLHYVRAGRGAVSVPPEGSDVAGTHNQSEQEGAGGIRITGAALLDRWGGHTGVVATGEPCTIRFLVETEEPIANPAVGLDLFRSDGAHVSSPSTAVSTPHLDHLERSNVIDFAIPKLPLLPGTYDVTFSVYDENLVVPLAVVHHGLRFSVEGGTHEHRGLVTLDGEFVISGEAPPLHAAPETQSVTARGDTTT